MGDRHVAVVAATVRESTRIARLLSDFLGPDDLVETETMDIPPDDDVRAAIVVRHDADPACEGAESGERRAEVIPVRYNLTKEGWRTVMKAANLLRGANVAVIGETLAAATLFTETLRRLEIEDLALEPVAENGVNGRRFDFLLACDGQAKPADAGAEQLITVGPLLLSPAVTLGPSNSSRWGRCCCPRPSSRISFSGWADTTKSPVASSDGTSTR
jgi:hypothetical protein